LPDKVLRAIQDLPGQVEFRNEPLEANGRRCAVTDCDAVPALEAAHILPYAEAGLQPVSNGLLMRADVHTLFDLGLVAINPDNPRIVLSPELLSASFRDLDGKRLHVPSELMDQPNKDALGQRLRVMRR
jgi:predicted restriction endonuclease